MTIHEFSLIETFAAANPLLTSALGFLCGVAVQHWLQLGRDRRLALEASKVPLREWIVNQELAGSTLIPHPSFEDMDAYESRAGRWKTRRFRAAIDLLVQAHQARQDTETGEILYELDEAKRKRAIGIVFRLTKPR